MTILEPQTSIVPILRGDKSLPARELLGTGFFVGPRDNRHLVTAKHIFESNPIVEGQHYVFALNREDKITLRSVDRIYYSTEFDVAACAISEVEFAVPMQFSEIEPALNEDVWSYEYSSTRFESKPSGCTHITFEPLAHKGNVMRYFDSTYPESQSTPSLQLSYPALQGASGAPVIATTPSKQFYVVGMMVANIERELLPAQVVRIEGPGEELEETKYFLPHGKAIHAKAITPFLSELEIDDLFAGGSNA